MRKKITDFIGEMSREELQDFQQHLKEGSIKSEIDKSTTFSLRLPATHA